MCKDKEEHWYEEIQMGGTCRVGGRMKMCVPARETTCGVGNLCEITFILKSI